MSGPNNFLARLRVELAKRDLPPHRVLTPAGFAKETVGRHELVVGRFDGLLFYRMTPAGAYNFIRNNKLGVLPRLRWLEGLSIGSFEMLDLAAARYFNRYDAPLRRRADVIVYQSELSRSEHRLFGQAHEDREPVHTIPNGVPLGIFAPRTPAAKFEGAPRLAITATFRTGKRLRDAIRAVGVLRGRHPNATLYVVGEMDRLTKDSLEGVDLSATVFLGHFPSEDLPKIYGAMDAGLSPALFDPCPNSVIEMLACGLPVLTTAASGAAELVPDARFIVPENAELAFVETLNWRRLPAIDVNLWAERIDAMLDRRTEMAAIARAHAERHFDIAVIADRYATAILKVARQA